MPKGVPQRANPVYSPEAVRAALREAVAVPAGMLNEALRVTHSKLKAKETKFFTYQGEVISKASVDAHDIQLRAAEAIQQMAELYSKAALAAPKAPTTTLEVDARTGVIRIIVGDQPALQTTETIDEAAPEIIEHDPQEMLAPIGEAEPVIEIVKVKRGELPKEIKDIIFGKE